MKINDIITESMENAQIITEASLSRVWQHADAGRPVATISGYRGYLTKGENMSRGRTLASYVKAAGYGFFWVDGVFWEKFEGTDEEWLQFQKEHPTLTCRVEEGVKQYQVFERSIVVMAEAHQEEALFAVMKKMCVKFEQDSFLFKPGQSKHAFLHDQHGNKVMDLGVWHPMKAGDFFSRISRKWSGERDPATNAKVYFDRTFAFESVSVYPPMSFNQRLIASRTGKETY